MMENIKEINVAEIFVAAVDDIDPEAMFDLRGRDLSVVFSDGSIANVHGPCELEGSEDDGPRRHQRPKAHCGRRRPENYGVAADQRSRWAALKSFNTKGRVEWDNTARRISAKEGSNK